MIKLVLLDLDGTLLESHTNVSKVNIRAVKAVLDKGIPVALLTGRNHHMTLKVVKKLNLPVYYCCVGGTEIYSPKHELIQANNLSLDEIKAALKIIKKEPCLIQITRRDGYFKYLTDASAKKFEVFATNSIKDRVKSWFTKMSFVNDVEDYHTHVFDNSNEIVVGGELDVLERIKATIDASDLDISCRMDMWPNYLFISKVHQSKGDAAAYLADYFGITTNEVMAFGDDYNDIDMLESVGYGIAMGNALEQVKAVSFDETKTNKEDGVAHAIHHYILEERTEKLKQRG